MDPESQFVTLAATVILAVIAWRIIKAQRAANTPEALARKAALEAAKQEVETALPPGWKVTAPDRERYGAGPESLVAYGVVAYGPDGERVVGIALSELAAYRTALEALRGEADETDAWAPPIPPLPEGAPIDDLREPSEVPLPDGWTLQVVDRERYYAGGDPLSTYGAMAARPGGERSIAVVRDKAIAVPRLIDRIEGRLEVTDTWAFRYTAPPADSPRR